MNNIYIALGSNLENKEENILTAYKKLEEHGIKIKNKSSLLRTKPYGVTDQPDFVNSVIEVETTLNPLELLEELLTIELEMGRKRLRHWGERNIDLDLLLYKDEVLDTEKLVLPHPDMTNRDFVMLPLAEIAPEEVHPLLKISFKELAKKFQ